MPPRPGPVFPQPSGSGWAGWVTAAAAIIALTIVVMRKPAAIPPPQLVPAATAMPAPVPELPGSLPAPAAGLQGGGGTGESIEAMAGRAMAAVVVVETATGKGSAFFVAPDTLLTNFHVVANNSYVTIRQASGETATAYIGATAQDYDLAILKSSGPPSAAFLSLGSAGNLRPGQEVLAIGSPLGLQNSVTRGIVSGLRQMGPVSVIQTDTAINPGNSGGPLLDRAGLVVGINTFILSSTAVPGMQAGSQGLNFAVAIDHAKALLEGRSPATGSLGSADPGGGIQVAAKPTEADQGARILEARLALIAQRADLLDDQWARFIAQGFQGKVQGDFDRPWYALLEPGALAGTVVPGYEQVLDSLRAQAAAIGGWTKSSDEAAREAGVYPGTRRDLRHKYRLEYRGWAL